MVPPPSLTYSATLSFPLTAGLRNSNNAHDFRSHSIGSLIMDNPSFILPRPRTYKLESVPPELIIYIADFLTSSSIACLGLTCRQLYTLTRERCHINLKARAERFEFLNCLARDLPDYIPCHGWSKAKLYRWRRQQNSYYHCDHCFGNAQHRCKYRRRGSNCPVEVSGLPIQALCAGNLHRDAVTGGWMTFGLRQLVLRYELLGPEYGVPLSTLDHSCFPPVANFRSVAWVKTWPKIVQSGNLMIHKTVIYKSGSLFKAEWDDGGPVCNHTSSETKALAEWGFNYFRIKHFLKKELTPNSQVPPQMLMFLERTKENDALHEMCKYPDNRWHSCSILLKCEYCATDTRFYIRKTRHHKYKDDEYELRFEVYHDLGSLYQPITIPQRQLIEVASRLPKVQMKYPSLIELHERIAQNLEKQYYAPAPLNVRGTAIHAMEQAIRRDSEMILETALPEDVCFFSHWSQTNGTRNSTRSPGFLRMLEICRESGSLYSATDEWYAGQLHKRYLPFERDPNPPTIEWREDSIGYSARE